MNERDAFVDEALAHVIEHFQSHGDHGEQGYAHAIAAEIVRLRGEVNCVEDAASTPMPDRDALLALADEMAAENDELINYYSDKLRALATPSPQADKARWEVLLAFADAVERLAFQMRAPNQWTPQFVQLAVTAKHAALSATHTQARPDGGEAFSDWLAREIPPGTIISDPKWWAPRIASAYERTHPAPADVARLVEAARGVKFDVYQLTTPELRQAFDGRTCVVVVQLDTVKPLKESLAPFTTDKQEAGHE